MLVFLSVHLLKIIVWGKQPALTNKIQQVCAHPTCALQLQEHMRRTGLKGNRQPQTDKEWDTYLATTKDRAVWIDDFPFKQGFSGSIFRGVRLSTTPGGLGGKCIGVNQIQGY